MKHGGKIGMKVTMRERHKKVKHMKVCVIKDKNINGSPKISIGNGWKELKTTYEFKVRDYLSLKVVVTMKIFNELLHFEGC
jgi:hypothetical protein